MNRRATEPIQVLGALILVVLVVVGVAVFFFAGLSQQGGILGQTSNQTVTGLGAKMNLGICGLGGDSVTDGICCNTECCGTSGKTAVLGSCVCGTAGCLGTNKDPTACCNP